MSALNPSHIDAIVRAVVEELNRRTRPAAAVTNVFPGKLLNQAAAEALGRDGSEVKIAPGTVVTPLALDHLKRRKITITYVSGITTAHRNTGEWGFSLGKIATGHAAAIRRALLADWTELTEEAEAVKWLVDRPSRGVFLLTNNAALACWKANQLAGTRAAFVVDADSLTRAITAIGLNCAVVEPERLSIPQVRSLAETFRQAGAPVAPEGFAS